MKRVITIMSIESDIFNKCKVNKSALLSYGFVYENNHYIYKKMILDDLEARIMIDDQVSGIIYDLETDDEYIIFRVSNSRGDYASQVKNEYEKLLRDIKKHCFIDTYFKSPQANRLTDLIIRTYHDDPDFPWDDDNGVFRNPINKKWYGLIMEIDYHKLNINREGKVQILDIKLDQELISTLINKKGFYPAYHMNKKYWITLTLDETLSDDEIMKYIDQSHAYTIKK